MGKSPVIYTRISRGTGIAGCFAGEHLSRAPPGSPGEGGGGGGKEKGFPPGPRGFWDFRALGPLRRQPRPAGGSSAPFCLPPGRGRCPALGREQRREKEKEAAAAGQG